MNPWLLALALGAIVGGLIVWLTTRPAPDAPPTNLESGAVVVSPPARMIWMAFVLTAAPLVVIPRILREPDREEALGLLAVMTAICALTSLLFIPARRKVIVSQQGVEVRGFRPFKIAWHDLSSIEAQAGGSMSSIRFRSPSSRSVIVGATMLGWHELLRRLPDLAQGQAREKALVALAELKRWG